MKTTITPIASLNRRLAAFVVILIFANQVAFATDSSNGTQTSSTSSPSLNASISRATEKLALDQEPRARTAENPYFVPGIVLMSTGGGIMLLGFANPGSVDCHVTDVSISCSTYNKGLVYGGLAAAGLGAALFIRGESMKERSMVPTLKLRRDGITVGIRRNF